MRTGNWILVLLVLVLVLCLSLEAAEAAKKHTGADHDVSLAHASKDVRKPGGPLHKRGRHGTRNGGGGKARNGGRGRKHGKKRAGKGKKKHQGRRNTA